MENILNIILERDKTKFVLGIMKDGKERTKQELLALDCLAESIRISIGTFDLLLNGNNEEKENAKEVKSGLADKYVFVHNQIKYNKQEMN